MDISHGIRTGKNVAGEEKGCLIWTELETIFGEILQNITAYFGKKCDTGFPKFDNSIILHYITSTKL